MRWISPSPEATRAAARRLAEAVGARGVVVALVGPLGAGKTAFAKGLAEGLGIDPERVASPTFVIASEYAAPSGARFAHVDLYRVESRDELESAGFVDLLEPDAWVAVEWADRFPEALPADRLELRIERPRGGGDSERRVLNAVASGERSREALARWRTALGGVLAESPAEAAERVPRGAAGPGREAQAMGVGSAAAGSQPLVVQKFGGTSVADAERIVRVARRIVETVRSGHRVAAVVSAMGGETDRLVELARQVGGAEPDPREYDVLLSTGEQRTIALVAMAIQRLGQPACSLTGAQMGMRTDAAHTRARIASIDASRIRELLESGRVPVIAGFQGIDASGNITTLGRGGSDTTAVAVAAALAAPVCEIYTDVDGVYTTDPNLVPAARKLARISYDEMIEMASLGARVLQIRAVRFAVRYGVRLHVRSSFKPDEGTWVVPEEELMEDLVVSGVTYNRNEAKIGVRGVKDQPGVVARLFAPLSDAGIVVDMIIQNLSKDGTTDVTFTVARDDYERALRLTRDAAPEIGSAEVVSDAAIAKVSIVGIGMKDHAGVATRMFRALADEGINIQMISTSEIKVSVVIEQKYTELAVRTLHAEFLEAGAAEPVAEA